MRRRIVRDAPAPTKQVAQPAATVKKWDETLWTVNLKSPVVPVVHQHIVHGLTGQAHTHLRNREYLPITRNNSCVPEGKVPPFLTVALTV